jgi:hypothetical protein
MNARSKTMAYSTARQQFRGLGATYYEGMTVDLIVLILEM